MESEPSPATPLEAFRDQYRLDERRGHKRSVLDYLELFQGDDDAIVRAFVHLERDASRQRSDGTSIGPYRTIREIGRGAQGVVYLAEDPRLRREVALKVLKAPGPEATESLSRFRREAEVASKLDHPGICRIFDAGTANGTPYIAMQFVKGSTIAQLLTAAKKGRDRSGTISLGLWSQTTEAGGASEDAPSSDSSRSSRSQSTRHEIDNILRVFEKAARALHAAHESGVIHRDIKPGNIMVTPEGEPVLLDFGLARAEDLDHESLTATGSLLGTPAYMSPEQLLGQRLRLDGRADVYSLGATLYECLALRRPFEAPTREALYQAILGGEVSSIERHNPSVSRDLRIVLQTAMDRDRERRYQSAEAFADDLERIRCMEPIVAKPAGATLRLRRWSQRNPTLATALALVFLLLVGGLAATAWFLGETNSALKKEAAARAETIAERASVFRLAAFQTLEDLRREADEELLPLAPPTRDPGDAATKLQAYDDWIRRANTLVQSLDEEDLATGAIGHRAQLQEIRSRGQARADSGWIFSSENDAWWNAQLTELILEIETFAGPKGRLQGIGPEFGWGVARRRSFLASSIEDSEKRTEKDWNNAITRISKNPKYHGLNLNPQLGLVPLGPDPESTLEEFWDQASGQRPVRDLVTGKLTMTEDSGLVFVLIPGGTFWMGSQKTDPDQPNFDPLADDQESPVHEITLSAFLFSKFEMTQGQWLRMNGHNPSGITAGLLHPVEAVTWADCAACFSRFGWLLPTEAQWEYACRAGTDTPWWTGRERETLFGAVNLADAAAIRAGHDHTELKSWPGALLDDKYAWSAPVGTYRANPFGLHEMLGNVGEWCREFFARSYEIPARAGDGLRAAPTRDRLVGRGGNFRYSALYARSSSRQAKKSSFSYNTMGVRPSRALGF